MTLTTSPAEMDGPRSWLRGGGGNSVAWLSVLVLTAWVTICFAALHFDIRDGGMGDESHRIAIAATFLPDLSPTFRSWLTSPWPPLPYIFQVLWQRGAALAFGRPSSQFMYSAIECTIAMYFLHGLAVIDITRRLRSSVSALMYLLIISTCADMTLLATSAMAESYAFVFMSLALWVFVRFSLNYASITAVAVFVAIASLARSEMAVFFCCFIPVLMYTRGLKIAALAGAVAASPIWIKIILRFALDANYGMSYFNLNDYYDFGNLQERISNTYNALLYAIQLNRFSYDTFLVALLVVATGFVVRLLIGKVASDNNARARTVFYLTTYFTVCSFGVLFALMVIGVTAAFPRYFVTPYLFLAFSLAIGFGIVFGPLIARIRVLVPIGAALVAGLMLWGPANALGVLNAAIPLDLRNARDFLTPRLDAKNLVVIDALIFWDPYIYTNAVIRSGARQSAMVYDMPPPKLGDAAKAAIAGGESQMTVNLLNYINEFEPAYFVAAGPEWRKALDAIPRFLDRNERSSYVWPHITWDDPSRGLLSLKRIGFDKSFDVTPVFDSQKIRVFKLTKRG